MVKGNDRAAQNASNSQHNNHGVERVPTFLSSALEFSCFSFSPAGPAAKRRIPLEDIGPVGQILIAFAILSKWAIPVYAPSRRKMSYFESHPIIGSVALLVLL